MNAMQTTERKSLGKLGWGLVLAALLLGVLWDQWVFRHLFQQQGYFYWSLYWMAYLVLFYALNWQAAKGSRMGWALAALAVVLSLRSLFYAQNAMAFLTTLAIPAVLMLHAQVASGAAGEDRDGLFALLYLEGWFVQPFRAIGKFFTTLGGLMKPEKSSTSRQVLLGFIIALPVVAIVGFLLVGADGVMAYYMQAMLQNFDLPWLFWHGLGIFIATLLFFSFLYEQRLGPRDRRLKQPVQTYWNPITVSVLLGILLALYALFTYVQFAYLFGQGGLPAGMTYAGYARSGFMQLMLVAILNLTVFGLCLRYTHPSPAIRGLLMGLLAATAVILASSFTRLGMYIGAYGLTWMRLLPFSFLVALSVLVLLSALRIWLPKLRLLRVGAAVLVIWFLALGFGNPEALIARVNLSRYEAGQKVSMEYLMELSSDAVGALVRHAQASPSADLEQVLRVHRNRLQSKTYMTLSDRLARRRLDAYFQTHP